MRYNFIIGCKFYERVIKSMKRVYKKSFAFTLAEILIALTIIGVVAALTVSNVMINVNAAHAKTGLRKGIAGLNQAILMNVNKQGYDCAEAAPEIDANDKDAATLYNILIRYMGAQKLDSSDIWSVHGNFLSSNMGRLSYAAHQSLYPHISPKEVLIPREEDKNYYYYYSLPDNMALIVPNDLYSCGNPRMVFNSDGTMPWRYTQNPNTACIAFLDVNGKKGPNQVIGCDAVPDELKDLVDVRSGAADFIIGPSEVDDVVNESVETFAEGVSPLGSPRTCTINEKSITDVYPIVFFNDKVYPATYASMTVYLDAQETK